MAPLIQRAARFAYQVFSQRRDQTFNDNLQKLRSLVNELNTDDINLDLVLVNKVSTAPVTFIHVTENSHFTMSVFVMKEGTRIPLHDHPGMHGILRVLHGKVRIASYNRVGTKDHEETAAVSAGHHPHGHEFEVTANPVVEVASTNEACLLTPRDGNLHEIQAPFGPAAFLDILAPPYRKQERDCHYYELVADAANHRLRAREVRSPQDFWTDAGEYTGPPVDLV